MDSHESVARLALAEELMQRQKLGQQRVSFEELGIFFERIEAARLLDEAHPTVRAAVQGPTLK